MEPQAAVRGVGNMAGRRASRQTGAEGRASHHRLLKQNQGLAEIVNLNKQER